MLTTSRNPGVIHAGYYTYKPSHGALGFMMSCVACLIMFQVLLRLFQEDQVSKQSMQMAAALAVVGCVLFYVGTTWFFSFITGYTRKLSIGDSGIKYGPAFYPWAQVKEVAASTDLDGYQVLIVLKRRWLRKRLLVTDDGLSHEMAEDLIVALKKQIVPHFPHLVIAPLPISYYHEKHPILPSASAEPETEDEEAEP